ncbi:MAG: helix-turn-helix transcriptional regulator [Planctomycetia bacterium]|nr:helix-turn-helix transcriptional regulator [Planctomycetia bacterium]
MAAQSNHLVRHFFGGFVRLHVLYHAAREPICGVEMIEELSRHGYRLSPGTLYPILHHLEESGYLTCRVRIAAGKRRKDYQITAAGRKLLAAARSKLRELFSEVVQDHDRMAAARATRRPQSRGQE